MPENWTLPRDRLLWVCSGCGGAADWTGHRKCCGACGSREREAWLFEPVAKPITKEKKIDQSSDSVAQRASEASHGRPDEAS